MRVRCPVCEAGYEIDDRMIGPAGRPVRCAACGAVWRVEPRADAPAEPAVAQVPLPLVAESVTVAAVVPLEPPAADAAPESPPLEPRPPESPPPAEPGPAFPETPPAPEPPRPAPAGEPPTSPGVWIGWVVTVLVLGAAAFAAVHYRAEVMAAWPPSEWIYAALGLYKRPG